MPPLLASCMNFDLKWVMGQFKQSSKCEMISNFHAYDITRFYFHIVDTMAYFCLYFSVNDYNVIIPQSQQQV